MMMSCQSNHSIIVVGANNWVGDMWKEWTKHVIRLFREQRLHNGEGLHVTDILLWFPPKENPVHDQHLPAKSWIWNKLLQMADNPVHQSHASVNQNFLFREGLSVILKLVNIKLLNITWISSLSLIWFYLIWQWKKCFSECHKKFLQEWKTWDSSCKERQCFLNLSIPESFHFSGESGFPSPIFSLLTLHKYEYRRYRWDTLNLQR